ncbi:MAG: methyltransferase domain-containing protein [Terriglobia bacterium]
MENCYLRRYLHGRGMEIGALWRRFPLPRAARVWYVDRFPQAGLDEQYSSQRKMTLVEPDLVADAIQLPAAPASLDFIIASHVLEHLPFPLAGLRAWYEALAPGGALLLRVPDKRYSFDRHRQRTPLAHLVEEYEHPERFDRRAHFADWVEKVHDRKPGEPKFEQAMRKLMEMDYSIHFHVWIDADVRELIDYTREAWRLAWEPRVFWEAHFYRKETVALLQKHEVAR